MLTRWFGNRSSRSLEKDRPFRPWLESLEERNAPSGGPGGDHDHGPPDHHHPPPPPPHHPGPVNNGVVNNVSASAGNGNHGSFNNSTITGSFNNTITNTINNTVNVMVNMAPAQAFAVEGLFGISSFLGSALSNPQLGTLLTDEVASAVDQYLYTLSQMPNSPLSGLASTLKTDLGNLQTAITGLETSPTLTFLGTAVHDITLDALMAAQPTI